LELRQADGRDLHALLICSQYPNGSIPAPNVLEVRVFPRADDDFGFQSTEQNLTGRFKSMKLLPEERRVAPDTTGQRFYNQVLKEAYAEMLEHAGRRVGEMQTRYKFMGHLENEFMVMRKLVS
jgi:hypothetical protein